MYNVQKSALVRYALCILDDTKNHKHIPGDLKKKSWTFLWVIRYNWCTMPPELILKLTFYPEPDLRGGSKICRGIQGSCKPFWIRFWHPQGVCHSLKTNFPDNNPAVSNLCMLEHEKTRIFCLFEVFKDLLKLTNIEK